MDWRLIQAVPRIKEKLKKINNDMFIKITVLHCFIMFTQSHFKINRSIHLISEAVTLEISMGATSSLVAEVAVTELRSW